MRKKLRKAYDWLRIAILYAFAFFALLTLQKYTLGFLPVLKDTLLIGPLHLKDILFTAIALIIIALFIKPVLPDSLEEKHFLKIKRVKNSHS